MIVIFSLTHKCKKWGNVAIFELFHLLSSLFSVILSFLETTLAIMKSSREGAIYVFPNIIGDSAIAYTNCSFAFTEVAFIEVSL